MPDGPVLSCRAVRVKKIGIVLLLIAGTGTTTAWGQTDSPPPLSPTRVSAIEPVLEASVVLDQQKPSGANVDRYTRRCRALGLGDDLIRAFRSTCRAEGDAFTASLRLATCKTTGRCRARIQRYADNLLKQADASRKLNKRLKTTVSDEDCRGALRISQRALIAMARLRSASLNLVHAIAAGSQKRVASGLKRFYAIDRSPLLDHRGRLDVFRAACT
jgi:hypothetical protein